MKLPHKFLKFMFLQQMWKSVGKTVNLLSYFILIIKI